VKSSAYRHAAGPSDRLNMQGVHFGKSEQQMQHHNTPWRKGEGSRTSAQSLKPGPTEHRSTTGRMQVQECRECYGYNEDMEATRRRKANFARDDANLEPAFAWNGLSADQDIVVGEGASFSSSSFARPRRKRMTPRSESSAPTENRRRRRGPGSALVNIAAATLAASAGSSLSGVMAQATTASSSVATMQR
jgi:hypothetical protein